LWSKKRGKEKQERKKWLDKIDITVEEISLNISESGYIVGRTEYKTNQIV